MLRFLPLIWAGPVFAQGARPIPQAQNATAELWFFSASVALLLALLAVHWLVKRR